MRQLKELMFHLGKHGRSCKHGRSSQDVAALTVPGKTQGSTTTASAPGDVL